MKLPPRAVLADIDSVSHSAIRGSSEIKLNLKESNSNPCIWMNNYNYIIIDWRDKLIRLYLYIPCTTVLHILNDLHIPKKFWTNRGLNSEEAWIAQGSELGGSELEGVWIEGVWIGVIWIERGLNWEGLSWVVWDVQVSEFHQFGCFNQSNKQSRKQDDQSFISI